MIANAVCMETWGLLYSICPVEPVTVRLYVNGGLTSNVALPDFFTRIWYNLIFIAFLLTIYFNTMLFVCRYCHTSDSRLHTWLSDFKKAVSLHLCLASVPVVGLVIIVNSFLAPREQLLDEMKICNISVYEQIQQKTVFGIKSSDKTTAILIEACCVAICAVSAVVWSTFGCYRDLRANKRALSNQTVALYRKLINALVIDMCILFCMVVVPFGILLQVLYRPSPLSSSVFMLMWSLCNWYPMTTHIVTLLYITPYRRAVIHILQRYFPCFTPSNRTTSIELSEATAETKQVQHFTQVHISPKFSQRHQYKFYSSNKPSIVSFNRV
ncbi:serpentine type 7TM GPCR chemoreceptor srh domain-containing protein [Ditylenchus destructor]|uniref:Serpentine type 7TM GPCR chemoreceptor srh domain-containing protein n=1 Tax=Ditylenchus destructor TaxID=166010 RepID=A0AAD4MQT6_9BILA|nr:serpentine type 7TM GPCR chemoreceptor srh domain-containing protein [Ditylenchus destructor]